MDDVNALTQRPLCPIGLGEAGFKIARACSLTNALVFVLAHPPGFRLRTMSCRKGPARSY